MLRREKMFDKIILEKMYQNFAVFGTIKEIEHHKEKKLFFKELINDESGNVINFTCRKMKQLAEKPFAEFKKKFEEKASEINAQNLSNENNLKRIEDFRNKIKILNYYIDNLEEIFFNCCPDEGFFTLSHNDAHCVNIMYTKNLEKVYLFDHEYSSKNFLGFDIANYIIESLFFLAEHEYPFYTYEKEGLKNLKNQNLLEIYRKFFDYFEEYNKEFLAGNSEKRNLIEIAKTENYYLRVLGLSSILWSMFACIYLEFDNIWDQGHYDYFGYAIDRLSIYHEFVRFELGHDFVI